MRQTNHILFLLLLFLLSCAGKADKNNNPAQSDTIPVGAS